MKIDQCISKRPVCYYCNYGRVACFRVCDRRAQGILLKVADTHLSKAKPQRLASLDLPMSIVGALVFGCAGVCEGPMQLAQPDNGGLIPIFSAWNAELLICPHYLCRSSTSARGALGTPAILCRVQGVMSDIGSFGNLSGRCSV